MNLLDLIGHWMRGSGDEPQDGTPPSKAEVDRPLYSEQNRNGFLQPLQAFGQGPQPDPLKIPYKAGFDARYMDDPLQYQPSVPVEGYLEGQRLGVSPAANPKDALTAAFTHDFGNTLGPVNPDIATFNRPGGEVSGRYVPSLDEFHFNTAQTTPQLLETYAHEVQHRNDARASGYISQEYGTSESPTASRDLIKQGHHKDFTDFEVDKPLYDLAKSAVASGEWVHPSVLAKFPDLLDRSNNPLSRSMTDWKPLEPRRAPAGLQEALQQGLNKPIYTAPRQDNGNTPLGIRG